MSVKPITIAHYRALSLSESVPTGRIERELELSMPCHQEMLERFAPQCRMLPVRRINWRQSFARRGFSQDDYRFEHEEQALHITEHQFERVEGADTSLPAVVRFIEGWTAAPSWKGTQIDPGPIFYVEKVPVLKAWRGLLLDVNPETAPEGLLSWAISHTWISRLEHAIALAKLIVQPGKLVRYQSEFLEAWDPARSFLSVNI
jgi:hypothetical protein